MPLFTSGGLDSQAQIRNRFIGNLEAILGANVFVWTPKATDTTTALDESPTGRTVSWNGSVASLIVPQGNGYTQIFNGASTWGTCPDTADLSFGTGSADSPMSWVALVNITNTANTRAILGKYSNPNFEWSIRIHTDDTLQINLIDTSAGVQCSRASNSAVTQDSFVLLGGSYNGVGGGSAGDGISFYQNGSLLASTATNNGSYVSMENTGAQLEVGSYAGQSGIFQGYIGLIALTGKNLIFWEHFAIKKLVNSYFNLNL